MQENSPQALKIETPSPASKSPHGFCIAAEFGQSPPSCNKNIIHEYRDDDGVRDVIIRWYST